MFTFRPYQWDAVVAWWEYLRNNEDGHPLIVMPTGTGKSLVIAGIVRSWMDYKPRGKILVITHAKELIEQNHDKMQRLWPSGCIGINSAGLGRRDFDNRVVFGGIASVANYTQRLGFVDHVLVDEAHRVNMQGETQYRKLVEGLQKRNPKLRITGLTATPFRLGQGPLDDAGLFTDICFDNSKMEDFNKLIYDGYLAPLVPKATDTFIDLDGVSMQGGDYVQNQLQLAVDKETITKQAVDEILTFAIAQERKCWLIFTTGIEHTEHVARELRDRGLACGAVHSGNPDYPMSSGTRDRTIEDLKAGRITAIANANVLTTGFDHPLIDLIAVIRPTMSPGLWVQMLGRGTRPVYGGSYDLSTKEGRLAAIMEGGKENCLVLDFARNSFRLGPINDPVIPTKPGGKGGEAPVKECPVCGTINHASVRHCVQCEHEFQFEVKYKGDASEEELIRSDMPEIVVFKVDHITYEKYSKIGKEPTLKASYYCGPRMFQKWISIQSGPPAYGHALRWWSKHTELPAPHTVEEALEFVDRLKVPTHLRVWVNKQFPEIMDYDFTGQGFGTGEPVDLNFVASVEKQTPIEKTFDDDIPF